MIVRGWGILGLLDEILLRIICQCLLQCGMELGKVEVPASFNRWISIVSIELVYAAKGCLLVAFQQG